MRNHSLPGDNPYSTAHTATNTPTNTTTTLAPEATTNASSTCW